MSAGTVTGGGRRSLIAVCAAAIAVVAVAVLVLANCRGGSSSGSSGSSAAASSGTASSTLAPQSAVPKPPPGMATIALASLPAEAQDVVDKLLHGGGSKYRQDGTTFADRENHLPAKSRGYYREYTVATPGVPDRGPRRIIEGGQGELYYTSDHYRTFQWVVRGGNP